MSAYLKIFSAGFTLIVMVVLMNLVIDPYGIYNLFRWTGVNTAKLAMQDHEKLVKAYLTTRLKPAAVVLGTSRADLGIDPSHPSWGADIPRFNLALAGGSAYVTRRFFEHVLATRRLKKVVFGLDFFAFNTIRKVATDYTDSVLAVHNDGTSNRGHLWNILVTSTLSLSAIHDSMKTLNADGSGSFQVINPGSGMRQFIIGGERMDTRELHFRLKVHTPNHSAHSRFRTMEELYLRHVYLAGSKREYAFENSLTGISSLQEFRRIVQLSRENNVDIHLFISPPHARQMEVIRTIGLWPLFEQWKRELVLILTEEGAATRYPLWDFSGYNSITTTDVPRDARMQEYLDSTHYTPFVGDMVLTRMMGDGNAGLLLPSDFGIRLTAASIEEALEAIREQQVAYRHSHPEDVREIEVLAEKFGLDPDFVVISGEPRINRARSREKQLPPGSG